MQEINRSFKTAMLAPLALGLGACASVGEQPVSELAEADAIIRQAEQGGAREYSALELDRAREKLAEAQRASDDEEYVRALRLAQQSAADAELALARAEAAEAEAAATEVREGIATLRREASTQ